MLRRDYLHLIELKLMEDTTMCTNCLRSYDCHSCKQQGNDYLIICDRTNSKMLFSLDVGMVVYKASSLLLARAQDYFKTHKYANK